MEETLRAKFIVCLISKERYSREEEPQAKVTLYPVAGASPENEEFFRAAPSGKIELFLLNDRAVQWFERHISDDVYVDFAFAGDQVEAPS